MANKIDYKKALLEDFEHLTDERKWDAVLYVEALRKIQEQQEKIKTRPSSDSVKRCSFCGKSQEDVKNLIVSTSGDLCICNECVAICNDALSSKD